MTTTSVITRCEWAETNPLLSEYHDKEWGIPVFDDQKLFEYLILEGMQAGLSWLTILKKRDGYRRAFDNFDAQKIACYDEDKYEQLLENPAIIRNRLKIKAIISNAKAFLQIQQQFPSFSAYLWDFVDNKTLNNNWPDLNAIPSKTPLSDKLSKELKKRGFKFVGSTICYSFLQATGMVNDHVQSCFFKSANTLPCHNSVLK